MSKPCGIKYLLEKSFIFLFFSFFAIAKANAVYVLDTSFSDQYEMSSGGMLLGTGLMNQTQYLALGFSLSSGATINSVEALMSRENSSTNGLNDGVVFELHSGLNPDGELLFHGSVLDSVSNVPDWSGIRNLNWSVGAGDYTLVFRAEPGFFGILQTPFDYDYGAPRPYREWFGASYNNFNWIELSGSTLSVRIDAVSGSVVTTAVPEPRIIFLDLFGLIIAAIFTKRSRRGVLLANFR